MSSSETRNISQVIASAGLPLLIAGMVLSAGLALYMTAGTLMRKLGPEGVPYVISDFVWICLWVFFVESVVVALGVILLRLAASRVSRPMTRFVQTIEHALDTAKDVEAPADVGIAEFDRLAVAFNRLQTVRRRQAEEIKDLARNVLHDLRTPIVNIQNESDRLSHGLVQPDEAASVIESISRSILRIIDINAEITRNYSRRVDVAASRQDLAGIVNESVDMYQAVAETRGVALHAEVPPEEVVVSGHLEKLQRLIGNLLDNAFKFTPEGGTVSVSLCSDGHSARLRVADTGPGIPKEDLDSIYLRFFRSAGTKDIPGTGLGLSMVHSIVELYGGEIKCESAPGKGACFFVTFPVVKRT